MGTLQTIFRKIAALPLIGPHGRAEADLILSGSKPVAMIFPGTSHDNAAIARLDKAVAAGNILSHPARLEREVTYETYSRPGYEDTTRTLGATHHTGDPLEKSSALRTALGLDILNNDDAMNASEKARIALARYQIDAFKDVMPKLAATAQDKINQVRAGFALRMMQEGKLHGVAYSLRGALSETDAATLDRMIESGDLVHKQEKVTASRPYMIYGQHGQEENMQRLEDMNNLTESRNDPADNFAAILGYSDADQAYFENMGQANPVKRFLLDNTEPLRRDLRIKLMLQDGKNWQRNP